MIGARKGLQRSDEEGKVSGLGRKKRKVKKKRKGKI